MNTTENYGLRKPEATDFFNVDDFNNNADVIDAELNRLAPKLSIDGVAEENIWERKVIAINNFEMVYNSYYTLCMGGINLADYIEDADSIEDVIVLGYTDAQFTNYAHSARTNPTTSLCCVQVNPNDEWWIRFQGNADATYVIGRMVVEVMYKRGK